MSNKFCWELNLPIISSASAQDIITITNSYLSTNFKEPLEKWLNEQVENKNLKGFKKNKYSNKYPFNQKNFLSILDLKFKEKIYRYIDPGKYNEKKTYVGKNSI